MFAALIAVKLLCKKPGLKDNNFQALGHKITALGIIAKVGFYDEIFTGAGLYLYPVGQEIVLLNRRQWPIFKIRGGGAGGSGSVEKK